jgi:DNA-binding PadR family transcriptional regulator
MPVKLGLLALLAARPAHGYELRQRFEDVAGGVWPLNIGQVYDALRRLERDGLVEPLASETTSPGRGGERRSYRATAAGENTVREWLHEATEPGAVARDELAVRVLIAHSTGADLPALIQRQRESFMRRLQRLARRKDEATQSDDLAEVLLLDLLQLRIRADSEWLDLAERRLSRTTLQPSTGEPT